MTVLSESKKALTKKGRTELIRRLSSGNEKLDSILSKLSDQTLNNIQHLTINGMSMDPKARNLAGMSLSVQILKETGRLESLGSQEEIGTAINMFDLGANWQNMSDVKKYTALGQQTINAAIKHGNLDPETAKNLGTASGAIGLAAIGYSQAQLIDNWGNLNDLQRFVGASQTFNNIAAATKVVQGINTGSAASASLATTKTAAAANTANTANATGSIMGSAMTAVGAIGAAYAVYNLVDNWGQGGAAGRVNGISAGAAVGSMILPGVGTAVGAVVGAAIGSVKTGKSTEQGARDGYRDFFKQTGIATQKKDIADQEIKILNLNDKAKTGDSNHLIKLSDGSYYDIGQDGSDSRAFHNGQAKSISNLNKVLEKDREGLVGGGELRPYEVDYTNDLDFMTSNSLGALQYIMGGGSKLSKDKAEMNQMMGYLTNGATSNIKNREFTEENFKSAMGNLRGFYANAGITNSDQAYNYLNQLRTEDKISQKELEEAMQGVSMAFENNWELAQKLNSTRWEGVRTIEDKENFIANGETLPEDADEIPAKVNEINIAKEAADKVDKEFSEKDKTIFEDKVKEIDIKDHPNLSNRMDPLSEDSKSTSMEILTQESSKNLEAMIGSIKKEEPMQDDFQNIKNITSQANPAMLKLKTQGA